MRIKTFSICFSLLRKLKKQAKKRKSKILKKSTSKNVPALLDQMNAKKSTSDLSGFTHFQSAPFEVMRLNFPPVGIGNTVPELGDRLAALVEPEAEPAQLVADEAGHGPDLGGIVLARLELQEQAVGGEVGLVGRVQIVFHLVEVADLELVAHHQQVVAVFIQRVLKNRTNKLSHTRPVTIFKIENRKSIVFINRTKIIYQLSNATPYATQYRYLLYNVVSP